MSRKRITYVDGYEHYDKRRRSYVSAYLNEPEREYFRDAMAAMGKRNQSAFIRECIFGYIARTVTAEERRKLQEVAEWRAESPENPERYARPGKGDARLPVGETAKKTARRGESN